MTEPRVHEIPSPWAIAGLVGLAGALFLVLATPLVIAVPWWAVAFLVVVWLVALVMAIAWFAQRPRALPFLASAVIVVWFATVVLAARQSAR